MVTVPLRLSVKLVRSGTYFQVIRQERHGSSISWRTVGIMNNCLLIVPSHLAKGLEFDAVIIAAFDEPFRDHPIDRKLLYVAMTRPMHELHIVGLSI